MVLRFVWLRTFRWLGSFRSLVSLRSLVSNLAMSKRASSWAIGKRLKAKAKEN